MRTSERRLDKMEFASLSSSFPLVSVADDDIIRILCVVRQHDNRDEDEDDNEGGFRVIGTTCAHNIASVIDVVVKLCCVLSVTALCWGLGLFSERLTPLLLSPS